MDHRQWGTLNRLVMKTGLYYLFHNADCDFTHCGLFANHTCRAAHDCAELAQNVFAVSPVRIQALVAAYRQLAGPLSPRSKKQMKL